MQTCSERTGHQWSADFSSISLELSSDPRSAACLTCSLVWLGCWRMVCKSGMANERCYQLLSIIYCVHTQKVSWMKQMTRSKSGQATSTQKLTCKGLDRQTLGLQVLCLCCAASKEGQVGPPRIACCQNRRKELCCFVTFGPVFA